MDSTSTGVVVRVEDSVVKATEALITTQDHGHFTVTALEQGRFTAQAFRGEYGQHRNVHLHRVASVTVENSSFGPSFLVKHADGTETRIYIYNA